MMRNKLLKYGIVLNILALSVSFSQTFSISGAVKDSAGTPLLGANVVLENTLKGTATDENGNYTLRSIKPGSYRIIVSMVGFSSRSVQITVIDKNLNGIEMILNPASYRSGQVIVSASKYEQSLSDLPVSASLITSDDFSKNNYTALDDALRDVSGVSMTLDQVSIRGSSGYSRGVGSRVLVAFDGIPLYTGDSGEIIWDLIPVYEIDRVEIIKGAASTIYGSTAIGGAINIVPKRITSNPLTFIRSTAGLYDKPSHMEWDWSDNIRTFNRIAVSHSQYIGNVGISASVYRTENYGYRKNDYDKMLGGYLKLNYDISENTSIGFWGTGYTRQRETFIYWDNLQNALSPPPGDLGNSQPSDRQILSIVYSQKLSDDFRIYLKPSLYLTHWQDETESKNESTSKLYRTELRSLYQFPFNAILVSGIEIQSGVVYSNIFGNKYSYLLGLFSQVEYNLIKNLKTTFGIRFDRGELENLAPESSISPKLGINYKLNETTVFRSSVGTGFRSPSLAEAFTSTSVSGINVKPNPDIKSEKNYSIEFGISHSFGSSLLLDMAVFHSEYKGLIEPRIDPADTKVIFENITQAKIQGAEINSFVNLLDQMVTVKTGYIYLWARDTKYKKALKYRARHSLVSSIDINYHIFNAGFTFKYLSRTEAIDAELIDYGIIKDGDKRVDIKVLDVRLSLNLFNYGIPLRFFLNANNLLNYNYVEMIGNISPIRHYSFSAELLF
ncbi:MAG: TonB-dependent receptor [Melioribacteraceae bacterium]|nr:TonB-dependent receptor [Melioribacteraceae bacterium]